MWISKTILLKRTIQKKKATTKRRKNLTVQIEYFIYKCECLFDRTISTLIYANFSCITNNKCNAQCIWDFLYDNVLWLSALCCCLDCSEALISIRLINMCNMYIVYTRWIKFRWFNGYELRSTDFNCRRFKNNASRTMNKFIHWINWTKIINLWMILHILLYKNNTNYYSNVIFSFGMLNLQNVIELQIFQYFQTCVQILLAILNVCYKFHYLSHRIIIRSKW